MVEYIVNQYKTRRQKMRAVLTVTGKDMIGILAEVSSKCSSLNVNVTEVTQSVLQDLFLHDNARRYGKMLRSPLRVFGYYGTARPRAQS